MFGRIGIILLVVIIVLVAIPFLVKATRKSLKEYDNALRNDNNEELINGDERFQRTRAGDGDRRPDSGRPMERGRQAAPDVIPDGARGLQSRFADARRNRHQDDGEVDRQNQGRPTDDCDN